MRNLIAVSLMLTLTLFSLSCDNSSLVGSDLLDPDGIEVNFSDTTTILATTVYGEDSLQTNPSNDFLDYLYLGQLDDPYFGTVNFESYIQAYLNTVPTDFYDEKNMSFASIDSIVMYMAYDTARFYGDTLAKHEIQIFQTIDELTADNKYYTKDPLPVEAAPLSDVYSFYPSKKSKDLIFKDDTISLSPGIRIPLYNSLAESMIADSNVTRSDTSLHQFLKGIAIHSNTENSVLSFDFSTARSSTAYDNKVVVYYRDTIPKAYRFPLGGIKHVWVDQDISGTAVETAVLTPDAAGDQLYVQGFNAFDIELNFPYSSFKNWGDVLIKKAELELTIAKPADDLSFYSPINFLFVEKENEEGERVFSDDVIRVLSQNAGEISSLLGGLIYEETIDGVEVQKYSINITEYFQKLIEENSDHPATLFLTPASPLRTPGRSIICGPNHEKYPLKLNVTYSIPK